MRHPGLKTPPPTPNTQAYSNKAGAQPSHGLSHSKQGAISLEGFGLWKSIQVCVVGGSDAAGPQAERVPSNSMTSVPYSQDIVA